MEKYGTDPAAKEPLIRSFLVPLEIADVISGDSITEHKSGGLGRDLNVDKHYERNQFGVVSEDSLEKLRQYALPGSLRTYTDKSTEKRPQNWGDTRSAGELRDKLGVPQERLTDFSVFTEPGATPTDKGEFTGKDSYGEQVHDLTLIYAYHTGNKEFLPPKKDNPNEQEPMPDEDTRKRKVLEFYRQHKPKGYPDGESGVQRFIDSVAAPWATQAQIAKIISDDYEDLSETERDTLPTKVTGVTFGKPSTKQRGQRRSKEMALSNETRAILEPRFEFLKAVRGIKNEIAEAFKSLGDHGARPILGKLVAAIGPMLDDYGFVNGNIERVKSKLPAYVATIAGFQQQLSPFSQPVDVPEENVDAEPNKKQRLINGIVERLATAAGVRLPG